MKSLKDYLCLNYQLTRLTSASLLAQVTDHLSHSLFTIISDSSLWLYHQSDNCDKCPWQILDHVSQSPFKILTHHANSFMLRSSNNTKYITVEDARTDPSLVCVAEDVDMGEFGVYDLDSGCNVTEALAPVYADLALLVAALVLAAAALLWWTLNRCAGDLVTRAGDWLGWSKDRSNSDQRSGGKERLRSLDTFRGLAIMIMIFVNDGGGGYWYMEHATWNGLYVADLVFPWFIWIMGVCIPMSVKSVIKKQTPVKTVVWQVTLRSVKLFMLGFILNTLGGWINVSRLRVPGVLQRFAICYFVVFMVGYSLTPASPSENKRLSQVLDIVQLAPQWLVMLALLFVHQCIVYLVPAPGCDAGYAGPGGLHDWSPEKNNSGCIGGITGYIDKVLIFLPSSETR